ncbi:MAG: glycoside hydrolase family 5 [Chloroflexota bacterium]|nr:MAG: glycoside hydrolase family 5 [Chloroflexota bacterium]
MRKPYIRLALICMVVALITATLVIGPGLVDNFPPRGPWVGCVRDPARLPPPPDSPDGRPANYLHTCGSRLYDQSGREVRIAGLNWAGLEGRGFAPNGLNERNWQDILDQVAALGYNTVRLPFSSEALQPDRRVDWINFSLNPGLEGLTGLEMLDRLIAGARDRGLKVILDRHYVAAGRLTTLWHTLDVPEERWIADWRMLAARYAGNDTVIAADLANEPHGEATWGTGSPDTDWRLAAERAGNAVLEANPYLLIFVEGIENYRTDHWWWGGNLIGARTAPVRLHVPNRLVYSPHDYGPAISPQAWFWDPSFPANMPAEWDRHWGYLHRENIAPIVVGEFGGHSVGADQDGQWQRSLVAYLRERKMGALIWALDPTWDTGGVLTKDWRTVNQPKQQVYQQLLTLPLDTGASGVFGRAPARFTLLYHQGDVDPAGDSIAFSFQIVNDSQDPADLSRFEARYWLDCGCQPTDKQRQPTVETQGLPSQQVLVDLVPTEQGGQDHYLRVRFGPLAGLVGRYQASGTVTIRFNRAAQPGRPSSGDYSYAPQAELHQRFGPWSRVTLYRDDQLVWGQEP